VKQPVSQRGIPATALAAAVVLSMATAADAAVAAAVLQAREAATPQRLITRDSYGRWLDRLADAARQVRKVFTGQSTIDSADFDAAAPLHASLSLSSRFDAAALSALAAFERNENTTPGSSLLPQLTNLPPPII